MTRQERLKGILEEYRDGVRQVLGDALDSVVLYGSQARGDATNDSDIDVLCIMKESFDYGDLILKTGTISADVSLRHDVVISTAFVTRADYEHRNTPFLMNVRREAVLRAADSLTAARNLLVFAPSFGSPAGFHFLLPQAF